METYNSLTLFVRRQISVSADGGHAQLTRIPPVRRCRPLSSDEFSKKLHVESVGASQQGRRWRRRCVALCVERSEVGEGDGE